MKEVKLIDGEYYYFMYRGQCWIIQYREPVRDNKDSYYSILLPENGFYHDFIKDGNFNLRRNAFDYQVFPATPEQIKHLNMCIQANNYVDYEYNKQLNMSLW